VPTALVTGASAGLGAAFARALAAEGYHLVLVARDAQRLAGVAEDLGTRYGVDAAVLPADLTSDEGLKRVEDRLGDPVDLLVNNAGIALAASVLRSAPEDLDRELALNVRAVMRLTRAALPGMVERKRGDILNVSSVAGFMAVPGSGYGATKAWVTNFSESVGLAARRHGVRVMALCPGYTRTEFQQRAGIDPSRIPDWLWLSADDVVRTGLRDLRRGRYVSVPDWRYKAAVFGLRYTPRWLVRSVTRRT
jgi:uncharacterized protein